MTAAPRLAAEVSEEVVSADLAHLAAAVALAFKVAQQRGVPPDAAVSMVTKVVCDHARAAFGPAYLPGLCAIVMHEAGRPVGAHPADLEPANG